MNDQATRMIVFAGGAALIYLFAKKMNVFGGGTAGTGTTTGGIGSGSLISQVGGTTATGGTMGGTTAATGVSAAAATTGGLNTSTAQDIYSTKPLQI